VVAKLIDNEFKIDESNSVDKRKEFDYSQFGYNSLHKVCELKKSRIKLSEYSKFKGIYFEVQI